jgi:hypothetical protein
MFRQIREKFNKIIRFKAEISLNLISKTKVIYYYGNFSLIEKYLYVFCIKIFSDSIYICMTIIYKKRQNTFFVLSFESVGN